jgi:hypothetical protein
MANGAGLYSLTLAHTSGVLPFTIAGAGLLTHTAIVTLGSTRTVNADAIAQDGTFDLAYYRQLARDGFDHPGALVAIRRLTHAPRIYMRTIDDAGHPVDPKMLAVVSAAFLEVAPIWSGGRFGIAGIDQGTETREGVSGFVTVRWLAVSTPTMCGLSDVGVDGGLISLNAPEPQCQCAGSFAPRVAKHELGHAFGMEHTGFPEDVMFSSPQTCDASPSARERYHANIIYARPIGNTDPDNDPTTTPLLEPLRVP